MFLAYVWIDKIYYSDDLPLTQMVLQRTTGVNTEVKDAEYDEDDENYGEMSNEGENKVMYFFVIDITCLCYASMWKNDLVYLVYVCWIVTLCFCYVTETRI